VLGSVGVADAATVAGATALATQAQREWAARTPYERAAVLQRAAGLFEEHADEIVEWVTRESGGTRGRGRLESAVCAAECREAATLATAPYGELLHSPQPRISIERRIPAGVVAVISPFNFPLNLVAHKVAPAIAAGCPIILKPAPQTPISALLLAEIIDDTSWPDGALAVMPLSNESAGMLVSDERIKLLTFTGSAAVGWQLKNQAGKKRVTLELGGNAGVIVHKDADLEYAVHRCVAGGFSYAGQTCISVQRIVVHHDLFEEFKTRLVEGARKLKCGDPMQESTDVPPLIREQDAVRVAQWIDEAVEAGAKLLCGGKRNGSLVEPAVLTETTPNMRVNNAEVFGPVVTVEEYETFDEALNLINNSEYGLQAGLFTRDAVLIQTAFEEIEVGGLIVGDVPTFRVDQMPYGGVKNSGLGREGLRYAIEDMTERKLMVMAVR